MQADKVFEALASSQRRQILAYLSKTEMTTLDLAVDALEALQSGGRQVGVITHVQAMVDRIPTQVRVVKEGGGRSRVELVSAA